MANNDIDQNINTDPPQANDQYASTSTTPSSYKSASTAFLTDVIPINDSRGKSSEFDDAKRKEIDGLESRNVWDVVPGNSLPTDTNVIGSRFVLTVKNSDTDHPVRKARLVAQGHTDADKHFLVHNSTTATALAVRMLSFLATFFQMMVWTCDVKQAYVQSRDRLMRKIALRPPTDPGYPANHVLLLRKPLYGLTDAGDYWHETFKRHLLNDITMTTATIDPALYYAFDGTTLQGSTATYVDDTLNIGHKSFLRRTD